MAWGRKDKERPPGGGAEGKKASTHKHNDNGAQVQQGKWLLTKCTCGAVVARDFNPGDEE
jgi:hypothetical protein